MVDIKYVKVAVRENANPQLTTRGILSAVIDYVPAGGSGITPAEMRDRIKMLDAVAAAGDTILLTADYHSKLLNMLNAFPWGTVNRSVVQVLDDVEAATAVPRKG